MKTNTTLVIVIAIVLIGGGLLFFGGGGSPNVETASASTLVADKQQHDFGEIDIRGGDVSADFALTNEGTEDIIIIGGTTSCGCTSGEIDGVGFGMHTDMRTDVVIPAGETKNLTVTYDPIFHGPSGTGLTQRSVLLKTNSSITPELEVRIKTVVVKNDQE